MYKPFLYFILIFIYFCLIESTNRHNKVDTNAEYVQHTNENDQWQLFDAVRSIVEPKGADAQDISHPQLEEVMQPVLGC